MPNKKILFFIGQLEKGGAERVISIISNKFVERGFDVEILTYYDRKNNYFVNDNVKLSTVTTKTNTSNIVKNIRWLRRYFKDNCDVVISFLAPFNMLSLFSNIWNSVPIIVADRNDPRRIPSNSFIRRIRNLLYKLADIVIVQTEHNKEYFNYLNDNKVIVINNPVDLKELKGEALTTKKQNTIVSVGRLMEQKNQLMLIDAFNELLNKHDGYKLIIYGEGPYRDTLENRIQELNLEDKVLLPGEDKDVIKKILDSKLFVLSSNYEGMPNSLIEAMCVGLPVISTKVSGSNELIINNENGILISINDKNQLLKEMNRLIEDEELSNKLAKNATKLNEELDVDSIVDKWVNTINKLIG